MSETTTTDTTIHQPAQPLVEPIKQPVTNEVPPVVMHEHKDPLLGKSEAELRGGDAELGESVTQLHEANRAGQEHNAPNILLTSSITRPLRPRVPADHLVVLDYVEDYVDWKLGEMARANVALSGQASSKAG